MKRINKLVALKKKPYFVTWSVVVIIVFCVAVAVYVFFQSGYEVVDFPDFKSRFLRQDSKQHSLTKDDKSLKHHKFSCYEGAYIHNIHLFLDLYLDFYRGSSLKGKLHTFNSGELKDKYLDQAIQYLGALTKDGTEISERQIHKDFAVMKIKVLKENAKKKLKNSFLLKSFLNAFIFYKKGQAALEAGGVEETMEKAQNAINNHNIEETYSWVLSLKDPEYTEITGRWLREVSYFIRIKEILEGAKKYVFSEKYSSKFLKTCESENV